MRTWIQAAAIRAVKTFLQTILGVWTAGTLITDIDWKVTLLAAFSAAAYSVITSVVTGLPEVDSGDYIEVEEAKDIEDKLP